CARPWTGPHTPVSHPATPGWRKTSRVVHGPVRCGWSRPGPPPRAREANPTRQPHHPRRHRPPPSAPGRPTARPRPTPGTTSSPPEHRPGRTARPSFLLTPVGGVHQRDLLRGGRTRQLGRVGALDHQIDEHLCPAGLVGGFEVLHTGRNGLIGALAG